MRVTSLVSALAVLMVFTAPAGTAQNISKHQGYWISFGIGLGWNLSNTIDGKAKGGGAAFLRMGGTPSQRLLVGGEAIGFATRDNDVDYGRGNLHAIVMYYLNVAQGL